MFIGIENLDQHYSSIEMPGLFVITVPTFSFAKSILLKTVTNNPYVKTALISFAERNGLFNVPTEINKKLFDIYESGNLLLSFAYIKNSKNLFSRIKRDMEKKPFESVDLVVIDIEQDVFISTTNDELATILSSWQRWLIQHKKTCVWIIHGGLAPSFVKNKILNANNMFNGLSNIRYDNNEIKYEVLFWHLPSSIRSNILLNLQFDKVNNEVAINESDNLVQKNPLTSSLSENNRVLLVKPKYDLQEVFPCEWNIFYSLDELKNEVARNISTTTIIIYIDSNIDINFTASNVLECRKIGGAQLKIILREIEPCLRNIDEKFIIDAGANLIIPHGVDFLRFISIIYAMQGSYFTRNIPTNIEDIDLNDCGKSYLPLADFVRQAIYLADCAQHMQINSSLLKFSLNKAIPAEEIAGLINIINNGDIFSFAKNYFYLFLFQCEQSETKNALTHLFLLPIEDLFFEQECFSGIDEIKNEIRNIDMDKKEQHEQWQSVKNISELIGRKSAISLPLALKIN